MNFRRELLSDETRFVGPSSRIGIPQNAPPLRGMGESQRLWAAWGIPAASTVVSEFLSSPRFSNMPSNADGARRSDADEHGIIFFDGVCNLCNGAVNFIIDRDTNGYFRFAPLQSTAADRLLSDPSVSVQDDGDPRSLVLVESGEIYLRSTAALRIARRLDGPWPLLYGAMILPRRVRDALYDGIATRRYSWFGRRSQCRRPTSEIKERFLDTSVL